MVFMAGIIMLDNRDVRGEVRAKQGCKCLIYFSYVVYCYVFISV